MTVFSIVKFFLGRGDELNLKGLSSELKKRVKKLRQEGDLVGAAELLFQNEHFDAAAALFSEARMPARAAEAHELAGNSTQAIALYKTIGNRKRAGELYAEMGQYEAAAQQMLSAEDRRRAAEFFAKGGQSRRAAEIFEELEEYLKAAKCYDDAGDTARKMEMFQRQFSREYKLARGNLKIIESARVIAKQAGLWLAREGHTERAVSLLQKAGYFEEAGKVYAKSGKSLEAAALLEEAGKFGLAARMYADAGRPQEAAAARAQSALAAGNIEEGARLLANAGEYERAAELFVDLKQLTKAAKLYARAKKYNQAGELFERTDKQSSAAKAYEAGGDFARAADLYARIGNADGELRVSRAMEDFYRVGRILVAQDRLEDAVDALQRVDSSDPRYHEALELRGDILWKSRKHGDAFKAYRDAFGDSDPNASNIQLLYKMGRCMESDGEAEAAAKVFNQVVTVDSNYRDTSSRLDRLSSRQQQDRARPASGPNRPLSGVHRPITGSHRAPKGEFKQRRKAASAVLKRKSSRSSQNRLRPVSRNNLSPAQQQQQAARPETGVNHPFELASTTGNHQRRYTIIEEIARGGMGIVFRARDEVLSRTVAFKILSQQLRDNEFARKYFLREARAAAKLQHTNIVSVYDAGMQDNECFMAMEFIDGKTLKQVVTRQGPFPEKLVIYIAQHACRGLQYAHERGIVHRDIKSGNIMLTNAEKTLKIMDFGLAKVVTETQQDHTRAIGTPFYMSPEQIRGDDLDLRSDIYSLGVTLFEIATGTVPFFKGDLAYHHVHTEPPSPRSLNPNISPGLENIILKAMEKAPDDRFENCAELLRALKSYR